MNVTQKKRRMTNNNNFNYKVFSGTLIDGKEGFQRFDGAVNFFKKTLKHDPTARIETLTKWTDPIDGKQMFAWNDSTEMFRLFV